MLIVMTKKPSKLSVRNNEEKPKTDQEKISKLFSKNGGKNRKLIIKMYWKKKIS